jgi:hypothetical protein
MPTPPMQQANISNKAESSHLDWEEKTCQDTESPQKAPRIEQHVGAKKKSQTPVK